MWIEILVYIIAGLGAGFGTGLAGLSAACVISPMLIVCLGMDPYTAVGIALASDVLASLTSTITYARNKNIDLKNGAVMLACVICFSFVGSYVARMVPAQTMGNFSLYMTLILGLKFLFFPNMKTREQSNKKGLILIIECIIFGCLIGFICGFVGAGGGMMMLLVLVSVMGYDLKTAVGTSVMIMTFTAFTGACSHFVLGEFPDIAPLVGCIVTTFVFAKIAALFANKVSPKVLNFVTGIVLTVIGISMIIINYVK